MMVSIGKHLQSVGDAMRNQEVLNVRIDCASV